jgi:ATP-dependent Clp protease adaptor protein ClpS
MDRRLFLDIMNVTEVDIDTQIDEAIKELIEPTKSIVLYNDDHNTFYHVIECLMAYCEHAPIQAEQCTLIIHHNGKCSVKNGVYDKLKPICEALLEQGLTAKIE